MLLLKRDRVLRRSRKLVSVCDHELEMVALLYSIGHVD